MNAHEESSWVDAFVDEELDLTSRLDFEGRMRGDAALARKVEALRQMRAAIRSSADYHVAPAGLLVRMAGLLSPQPQPVPVPVPVPGAARPTAAPLAAALHRWLGWRPLALSFGLAAALLSAVHLFGSDFGSTRDERLQDEVVASHVRATLGQHLVDIASSDHHTVKPWLSARLDFSPPVAEHPLPNWVFLGGRVDYLDGHPAAALVYRNGGHVMNSFVWPARTRDSEPVFSDERGFRIARWSSSGMTHWVISDVNRTEFDAVVGLVRSAEK